MIYIIIAWVFWFIFCFNIGFFVLRMLRENLKRVDFFYNFWFGLFILIMLLGFISIFSPLNDRVLISLTAVNALLLVLNIKNAKIKWKPGLKAFLQRIDIKKVLGFAFLALFIAMLSNLPTVWYDSLLYHLNSVKWLADYGTVRGLANIYFPLGYNNATFPLAAIMDNSIYTNSSSHVINSFLFVVFSFQIILFLLKKQRNTLAYVFGFFSLAILSTFAGQLNSLSTDLGLAVFVLLFNFYVIIFDKENLMLALPILSLAATTKFSYFVVLALFSVFILIKFREKLFQKKNFYILLATLFYFVSYISRNLILSGWAFYPLKLFGFNFKWQVPSEQIKIINDGLTAWARLPGPNYMSSLNEGFWGWFVPWFNNNKNNDLMFYSFILTPLIFGYLFIRNKLEKRFDLIGGISKIDFLIFANLVTLVYSFIAAPDYRYMSIYVLVGVYLIFSILLTDVVKINPARIIMALIFIYLISSNLSKGINFSGKKILLQKDESAQVKQVTMTYPDQTFSVLVPVKGDQCGNSELPCVPNAYGFKMLQPGNIKAGFYSPK